MLVFVSQSSGIYRSFRRPPEPSFSEALFRTGKLEETLTEGATLHPATEGNKQYSS